MWLLARLGSNTLSDTGVHGIRQIDAGVAFLDHQIPARLLHCENIEPIEGIA